MCKCECVTVGVCKTCTFSHTTSLSVPFTLKNKFFKSSGGYVCREGQQNQTIFLIVAMGYSSQKTDHEVKGFSFLNCRSVTQASS